MPTLTEVWRPVVGYETTYEVSSLGRVRSLPRYRCRGKILKPRVQNGYLRVVLCVEAQTKSLAIHRLVAAAFIGPRPEGRETRHLDGTRTNNAPSNLAYGTHSQNVMDTVAHGTHWATRKTHCPWGHPYDERNTALRKSPPGTIWRTCVACQYLKNRALQMRRAGKCQPS